MNNHKNTDGPASAASAHETKPVAPSSFPKIEKFTVAQLTGLRNDLLRAGLDSWQAADVAGNFLAGHGYGAGTDQLRALIANIEVSRCSIDCLQSALEGVAYIQ